jgi:hypothetical protein
MLISNFKAILIGLGGVSRAVECCSDVLNLLCKMKQCSKSNTWLHLVGGIGKDYGSSNAPKAASNLGGRVQTTGRSSFPDEQHTCRLLRICMILNEPVDRLPFSTRQSHPRYDTRFSGRRPALPEEASFPSVEREGRSLQESSMTRIWQFKDNLSLRTPRASETLFEYL